MSLVLGHIFGIDEDIVEVDDDANVKEVTENVIHEALESGRGICKSERYNEPFKRAIASAEYRKWSSILHHQQYELGGKHVGGRF